MQHNRANLSASQPPSRRSAKRCWYAHSFNEPFAPPSPLADHLQHMPTIYRTASQRRSWNSQLRRPRIALVRCGVREHPSSTRLADPPCAGSDRFTSKTDGVDEALKKSTYGLVQLSDFRVGAHFADGERAPRSLMLSTISTCRKLARS